MCERVWAEASGDVVWYLDQVKWLQWKEKKEKERKTNVNISTIPALKHPPSSPFALVFSVLSASEIESKNMMAMGWYMMTWNMRKHRWRSTCVLECIIKWGERLVNAFKQCVGTGGAAGNVSSAKMYDNVADAVISVRKQLLTQSTYYISCRYHNSTV